MLPKKSFAHPEREVIQPELGPKSMRVLGYVMRNVRGKPWIDHLALIAAVMTAQRRDAWTVEATLKMLHPRFSSLFPLFALDSMSQWAIEPH